MSKFKQTTLFGSLARPEHIYKHPANIYETFIEMWWRQARGKETAQMIQKHLTMKLTIIPPPQSPPIPSTSCPETADKGDDSTLCVVCKLGEDEDEEDEVWIECTQCYRWVHESCLLPNY